MPEVTILCYEMPDFKLPGAFRVVSLGKDPGPAKWGTPLAEYFESIEDEYMQVMMEDIFITGEVDTRGLAALAQLLPGSGVDRVDVSTSLEASKPRHRKAKHKLYMRDTMLDVFKMSMDMPYLVSLRHSAWKKKTFIKLARGRSPWDMEKTGSQQAPGFGMITCFTNRTLVPQAEVARRVPGPENLITTEIPQHICDELRSKGLLRHWR